MGRSRGKIYAEQGLMFNILLFTQTTGKCFNPQKTHATTCSCGQITVTGDRQPSTAIYVVDSTTATTSFGTDFDCTASSDVVPRVCILATSVPVEPSYN